MKKSEAIKAINDAFWRLARCCDHRHEWDQYLALHWEEEKGHRRFKPDHVECGLTRAQSVRLFAVKEVFDRWIVHPGNEHIFTPEAKDYFSIRKSVFAACAIADLCGDKILKEFPLPEMKHWLESIDYAELNKDPRQAEAA